MALVVARVGAVVVTLVVTLSGSVAAAPVGPASGAPPAPGAVSVCGRSLCAAGRPFVIRGATAYGTYSEPKAEVALARAAGLNTLELVEFDTRYHVLSDTMSTATWDRVDRFIAVARSGGLHVILDLAEYGQSLQAAGETPTTVDWEPYLRFIADRRNTRDGLRYRDDPTLAMVELFGEACYPGQSSSTCPPGTTGTTAEMRGFFDRSEREWHALAPKILVSSGGLSHLDHRDRPTGVSSGIPYRAVYADPADAVCDLEVNSPGDLAQSIAKVTGYCRSIGKPWFLSAWSSCYQDPEYPYYFPTDASMAAHARAMAEVTRGRGPSREPAVGTDFWNLDQTPVTPGTCDIGPQFPKTWAAVQPGG